MRSTDERPRRRTGKIASYSDSEPEASSSVSERATQEVTLHAESEDDAPFTVPRSPTSAINRTKLQGPLRTTGSQQPVPVPQRRAGLNRQPTGEETVKLSPRFGRAGAQPRKESLLHHLVHGRVHWLLPLGVGMIAMLILWEVGSVALSWGMNEYNNIVYGMPRTYQTNAVVGHADSAAHPSHFIAVNLNHQAIVIEFPGGNPQNAKSYIVPYYILGADSADVPVTVAFKDVTGDGKPDMIVSIHLQSQVQTFVFINTGTQFRPPTSSDHINMNGG
jgi:hypothetical protein